VQMRFSVARTICAAYLYSWYTRSTPKNSLSERACIERRGGVDENDYHGKGYATGRDEERNLQSPRGDEPRDAATP